MISVDDQKKGLTPIQAYTQECHFEEPRKKEAARRIIEMSGELHLTISELKRVLEYVQNYALLSWGG